MSEAKRCVCAFCDCDYKLEGYQVREIICGACYDNCNEEGWSK